MISRSVAQIATASMRTKTSARLGTGTGFSVSLSSPGLPRTQAFIISGIGKSALVFTPGPAYMVVILVAAYFGRILGPFAFGRPLSARDLGAYNEFRCRAKPPIRLAPRPRRGRDRQKYRRL